MRCAEACCVCTAPEGDARTEGFSLAQHLKRTSYFATLLLQHMSAAALSELPRAEQDMLLCRGGCVPAWAHG